MDAQKVGGEVERERGREKESWWWGDSVESVIKEKKVAYKAWQKNSDIKI